jgi:hypothetical protein
MKKFLFIFLLCSLLFFPVKSFAGNVSLTFEWEQVISPEFAGWKMYMSQTSGTYPATPWITVPYASQQTVYTHVEPLSSPDGETHTYYFVLTAFDNNNNESAYSDEVSAIIDFEAPSKPFSLKVTVQPVP